MILAALFGTLVYFPNAEQACRQPVGTTVTLRAPFDDDRVFVFNSQYRLRNYEEGNWSAVAVTRATVLVNAGTTALVVLVCPNAQRMFRVKLLNGAHRGTQGYVDTNDVL